MCKALASHSPPLTLASVRNCREFEVKVGTVQHLANGIALQRGFLLLAHKQPALSVQQGRPLQSVGMPRQGRHAAVIQSGKVAAYLQYTTSSVP